MTMPGEDNINQTANIGHTVGVQNGDNIFYPRADDKTLKHLALDKHNDTKSKWEVSKTCGWLLQNAKYQEWTETKAQYSCLWLHGDPGCGKSTLMSRVIESVREDLFKAGALSNVHLLYFYVGYGDETATSKLYRNLLLTFWQQTSKHGIDTFGDNFPVRSISEQLQKLLVSLQRDIYIFIDALDQFPEDSRYNVIKMLEGLTHKLKSEKTTQQLKTAISSRNCQGIYDLPSYTVSNIKVSKESNNSDIQTYLRENLKSKLLDLNQDLRNKVLRKLGTNVNGIFMWAELQTLRICKLQMEFQVLNALENLIPSGKMEEMYQNFAREIESMEDPIQQQIAKRTIALLTHSTGSIPIDTLIVAVSFSPDEKLRQQAYQELSKDHTTIARFCRDLVRVNERLGLFEFYHPTVYEFFSKYEPISYSYLVADLCLSYLCSPEFSDGARDDATWYDSGSLGLYLRQYPFLLYASFKWASCLNRSFGPETEVDPRNSYSRTLDLLENLFDKYGAPRRKGNLQLAFQVYFLGESKVFPGGICNEHIVSYFGLGWLFDGLNNRGLLNLDERDDDGLTPMHWAAQSNLDIHNAKFTVDKLIEYGADINATDREGRTPLYHAAYRGNLGVTELLVEKKAQLDVRSKYKETALIAACRNHHEEIIRCLVKANADVSIQSAFGTALQSISFIGCCRCAETILEGHRKPSIIEYGGPFRSSLHAASFYGHTDLVGILCSKHSGVRVKDKTYGSPITAAAIGCNPGMDPKPFIKIIEMLIKNKVKINDRSGKLGPALRAAAYHGNSELVSLLIANGANVRKAKGQMGTAYEAAYTRGHQQVMGILKNSYPGVADHYVRRKTPRAQDFVPIQGAIFRSVVKSGSTSTLYTLISQATNAFKLEMNKGDSPFLRRCLELHKICFLEFVDLATKSHKPLIVQATRRDKSWRIWLPENWPGLPCLGSTNEDGEAIPSAGPVLYEESPHPLRARAASFHDPLGEHFSRVFDAMTQAAVTVMIHAIEIQDDALIRIIADTWVDALNKLISYPSFGHPMLEKVVRMRSDELKDYFTSIEPGQGDFEGSKAWKKATARASVGTELLLAAAERGQSTRNLCFVISKIKVAAINNVEELGREGEKPLRFLVREFTEKLANGIKTRNRIRAEIGAQVGIDLLRAAALHPKANLFDMFCERLVLLWGLALDYGMECMVKGLIHQKLVECRECLKDAKYVEALSLALVGIRALRTVIKYQHGQLVSMLLDLMESYCLLTHEDLTNESCNQSTPTGPIASLSGVFETEDWTLIFTASASLYETAEEKQPGLLDTLCLRILDIAGILPIKGDQAFMTIINCHIEHIGEITDPSEQERQAIQVLRMTLVFLQVNLTTEGKTSTAFSSLATMISRKLGALVPCFLDRGEFARYERAIAYLKFRAGLH